MAGRVPVGRQRRRFWIDLHTLPRMHPFWTIRRTYRKDPKRFPSHFHHLAQQSRDLDVDNLERIECFCQAPWQPRAQISIFDRQRASEHANDIEPGLAIFTDASIRNGVVGVGISCQFGRAEMAQATVIGPAHRLSVHYGELAAIKQACQAIHDLWTGYRVYSLLDKMIVSDINRPCRPWQVRNSTVDRVSSGTSWSSSTPSQDGKDHESHSCGSQDTVALTATNEHTNSHRKRRRTHRRYRPRCC